MLLLRLDDEVEEVVVEASATDVALVATDSNKNGTIINKMLVVDLEMIMMM